MRVLMVATELAPYAKVGGLADVMTALSGALMQRGHDVRVLLPRYGPPGEAFEKEIGTIGIAAGFEQVECRFTETEGAPGIRTYLLGNAALFERKGIYADPGSNEYADNAKRFSVLCRSIVRLESLTGFRPEIVHAHDWPAAPALALVQKVDPQVRGVLTIHNAGHQGIFAKHDLHYTGLEWRDFLPQSGALLREYRPPQETISFLQSGVLAADVLTTVSPTYAMEIRHREFAGDLASHIRRRSSRLFGILNGVDYTLWNPESDTLIPDRFSVDDVGGKVRCKRELQERCGFDAVEERCVIGMVSRLVEQKGFAELCDSRTGCLPAICATLPVQVVILGEGQQWITNSLEDLSARYANLRFFKRFDERLAHLIEAGSDFFLMPSRYEPCGLNQMYSLAYGAIPIVRKTGGLADTVIDHAEGGASTGFVYAGSSPSALLRAVRRAVRVWTNERQDIRAMMRRGMQQRFTWEKASIRYEEAYEAALRSNRRRRSAS